MLEKLWNIFIFNKSKLFQKDLLTWPKQFVEATSKFTDIFFSTYRLKLTSNQRRLDVLCPLETQLFVVPTVVIRPKLFELSGPENPVEPSLKLKVSNKWQSIN